MDNGMERLTKFRESLYRVFATPDGQEVINFLQSAYVDTPALDANKELTYYKLGQKEFVQGLIKDALTDPTENTGDV